MISSYEELMQAVEERRQDTLTLSVNMSGKYSPEHEEAKAELKKAQALAALTGGNAFLSDNLAELEAAVENTTPEQEPIWIRYKRLELLEWAALMKSAQNMQAIDQYEKVLPKTFVGVYGENPSEAEERGETVEPLSTDFKLLSSASGQGILPGGTLHQVIQTFMAWQNSGGEVTISPTRSSQD